jgi:hypothetical protein
MGAPATAFSTMASTSLEQQRKIDEDLADRDRQASSLAAAGMVAESVRLAQPVGTAPATNFGLQPPPQLVTAPVTQIQASEVESINWNMMELGSPRLDDLDLDFAALFDPIHEIERMRTEGSGWPSSGAGTGPTTGGASSAPGHPASTS